MLPLNSKIYKGLNKDNICKMNTKALILGFGMILVLLFVSSSVSASWMVPSYGGFVYRDGSVYMGYHRGYTTHYFDRTLDYSSRNSLMDYSLNTQHNLYKSTRPSWFGPQYPTSFHSERYRNPNSFFY